MAAAGLTHGGFYRHFHNKEQLVAEALSAAGDKTIAAVGRNIGKGGVNAAVDNYLSTSHRDSPSPICPFAALGSEMARAGEETKAAATEVRERLFATLAGGASGAEARGQAIVGLSTMIGAMTLARIVADSPLSEEILNRAKDHLHRYPALLADGLYERLTLFSPTRVHRAVLSLSTLAFGVGKTYAQAAVTQAPNIVRPEVDIAFNQLLDAPLVKQAMGAASRVAFTLRQSG